MKFRYDGKTFILYKRSPAADAPWYFRAWTGGLAKQMSLGTSAEAPAIAQAKLLIDAAGKDKLAEVRAVITGRPLVAQKEYCDIETYLNAYENMPSGKNSAASRHCAVLTVRRLLAAMPCPPTRMDGLKAMFDAAAARASRAIEAVADNGRKQSMKRTFNSTIAYAACVFSEHAVYFLKEKLELPDFAELRQQLKFLKFNDAKKTTNEFNPPVQSVLDATLAGWLTLPRNEFIAVGMALCCGARRGEIRDFADWSWFEMHGGHLWVNARTGNFKDRTDVLRAQVVEPFYSLMMKRVKAEKWDAAGGRMIQGNHSEFDRNVSEWMEKLGWDTRLKLHSLRAWTGSLIYMKFGADAACKFCRHSDKKTTLESYGWLREEWHTDATPVTVASRPLAWATRKAI